MNLKNREAQNDRYLKRDNEIHVLIDTSLKLSQKALSMSALELA